MVFPNRKTKPLNHVEGKNEQLLGNTVSRVDSGERAFFLLFLSLSPALPFLLPGTAAWVLCLNLLSKAQLCVPRNRYVPALGMI